MTAPLTFGAVTTASAAPPDREAIDHSQTSTDFDTSRVLSPDGRFVGISGVQGTIDTASWRLVSDLTGGEAPRLARVTAPSHISPQSVPTWSALGGAGDGAVTDPVFAMAVMGSSLYIGGLFTNVAGISTADYIARWDGSAWHNLDSNGANSSITDTVGRLAVWKNNLYVGGDFKNADGIPTADYIARWDGNAWHNVGSNGANNGALDSVVTGFGVGAGYLYVGGWFSSVGGDPAATHIARWNGSNWSKIGSGPGGGAVFNSAVFAIVVVGSSIYAGGTFTDAAGIKAADFIARWNGSKWRALGTGPAAGGGPLNNYVYALAFVNGGVYVGGSFTDADGITRADYIARWNGTAWSALGSNGANDGALDGPVLALERYGTDLYVGGGLDVAGVANTGGIARWNGLKWSAIGTTPALDAQVNAIAIDDTTLYVGGHFQDADGIPEADRVASYGPIKLHQPDGRIAVSAGALLGDNVYNANGTNQTRTGSAAIGATITFTVSVQNGGNVAEAFKLKATGTPTTKYTVRYFDGATEVTPGVLNGTYKTPVITPGTSHVLTATVKVNASATAGSSISRLVTISSTAESGKGDAVKLIGKRQ